MKIQYCSDLHLEFKENKAFLEKHPIKPEGEILLLAGDIVPFAVMKKAMDFFGYLSDNFETVYWLPGNHEYYYSDIADRSGVINEAIKSNVFLVNNTSVMHENVKLIFSTLWSKISPLNEWTIENSMSDFHVIKYYGNKFRPIHFNALHQDSLHFLSNALNKKDAEKTIVVTHHVPTLFYYPEKYKGDALNEAFAVELYDLIINSNIDYWIFGHHHSNINAIDIVNTKIHTNQLGYVRDNEHKDFNDSANIDINNFDSHNNKAIFA